LSLEEWFAGTRLQQHECSIGGVINQLEYL